MGIFDYYQIDDDILCNNCSNKVIEFQGKDGPCGLFVWKIKYLSPVDQRVDDAYKIQKSDLFKIKLPKSFYIYGYCNCGEIVKLICKSDDTGKWNSYDKIE